MRSCLEANKNELRQRVPNDAAVGRCCLGGWRRPTTHNPAAPAQNLKVSAMKMLACLYGHTQAQRKDPIPIARIGIAALQPRQLVLRNVGFLMQGLRRNAIRGYRIVYAVSVRSSPMFGALFVSMTFDPVCVEKCARQLKIIEARVIRADRHQLLARALCLANWTLECLDGGWR